MCMAVVQRTGADSKPRLPCVVSKSDRDHGMATTTHRTLGLMPMGTISRSNLSHGLYPLHLGEAVCGCVPFSYLGPPLIVTQCPPAHTPPSLLTVRSTGALIGDDIWVLVFALCGLGFGGCCMFNHFQTTV